MNEFYTSRSAIESYQDCPRYRYNQYYLGGKGLVPTKKSVPLVTGSAVHRGIEHILCRVRINQPVNVDIAVQEATRQYRTDVELAGFIGKGCFTEKQHEYTFNEQLALVEGLIRAWAIAELPMIVERYEVLAVERDLVPLEIAPGIWLQVKVDAEFRDKASGDYVNYSIKTARSWGEREENSYKADLQGITEMWGVEADALRNDNLTAKIVTELGELSRYAKFPIKNVEAMMTYLNKQKQGKKVSAVRFCVLIKGNRKRPDYFSDDPDALYITYSPLIRGYKRITPSEILYAHSWFVPNIENKSGRTAIGRSWEPFNVWEEMGVAKWIDMIRDRKIQPTCGDVIKDQVVTPVEYFRSDVEMGLAMQEIAIQEYKVREGVVAVEQALSRNDTTSYDQAMAKYFPHIRKHCEFHFGGPCEYKDLCWREEVTLDPIGSGLYQIRLPHHEAERGS